MQLTSLQQGTVNEILRCYESEEKVVCEFKAPTGSGKTLMASAFISHLIERHPNERFIFIIATPSASSLPYFFEQKINKYKADLPYSKFEVAYIRSPSSAKADKSEAIPKILPERNKVYIFGKASFGKGRILQEYGIIADFVHAAREQGYRLIYIRDEAHIGGEKIDNGNEARNFEALMTGAAAFVLKMTATPSNRPGTKKVVLRERDLNSEILNEGRFLLKTTFVPILDKSLEDERVLAEAIRKFKKVKAEYASLSIGINPAMLIQVENSSSANKEKKAEFETALADIKKTLTAANLSWVQYFGDGDKDSNRVYKNDFSLDDITRNTNDIDVVIFKIGPATGWDIPRACMLVQLRKVSSLTLNTQTLGRIKRNPYPGLTRNEVTDKYYVLSNVKDEDEDVRTYSYRVQKKFAHETFLTIALENEHELRKDKGASAAFKKAFRAWLKEHTNHLKQCVASLFGDGTSYRKVILQTSNGKEVTSCVTNPFLFLRDYKRLCAAHRAVVERIRESVAAFARKEKMSEAFLMTVLLELHRKEIREMTLRTRTCKPIFKIKEGVYDPKEYFEIQSGDLKAERISRREYLFDIDSGSGDQIARQPLDSTPEEIIFDHIYNFSDESGEVKLWAKNQTSSNVFGNYLDENNEIHRSYFDFIVKFRNGHYLYIEVKGKDDIDAEKTARLEVAYRDYFRTQDLFSPKLTIAVCRVDTANRLVATNLYYDVEKWAKVELAEKDFPSLLKTIAEIDCTLIAAEV